MADRLSNMLKLVTRPVVAIALILALSMAVSACGRRGNLEAPPSATVITADEEGETAEPAPKEDKPFILDGLL